VSFRVAYVITHDAADAEDAVQDAVVKAWRALGRFRAGDPLRPWLLAIVANEARNRRRSAGRRLQLELRATTDETGSAADAAVAADERRALLEALRDLPHDAQLVLACRYLLGLSELETAAVLGIGHGTVKSRTSRALDRLRERYA
jgi:RNA polymerase sigma factor (sigma-70 family)